MITSLRAAAAFGLAWFLWCTPLALAQAGLTIESNKLSESGFEGGAPSYWSPSGAGATWAADRFRTAGRSLRLGGPGEASWTMGEAVRNWTNRFPGNADLEFGAWVWTEGVNTAPSTDAAKYQLVYTFRDADGNDLLGQPVVLDLPQAQATTGGWVEVSTASLGAIVLPEDAASATVVLRKGADAAGAAYVDDLFVRTGTEGVWPGDLFNANVEVPGGWYYWWDGFPTGSPEWPAAQPFEVTVTTSEAHTGASSLRIEQRDPAASEAVAVSQRVPVTPGQPVLLSYWVKTAGNADPATIGTGDNNVGLTALWYNNMEGGAAGYGEIGGADIRLNGEYNPQVIPLLPQQADNGWTQYAFVVYPAAEAVGMELRLRYWHSFTGATYWDDVFVGDVPAVLADLPSLNAETGFEGGAPSYWSPSGAGATWAADRFRTAGRSLRLGGPGEASWTMGEAVRNWTNRFPGNADLEFGAWVWTEGVNTAPSTDAAKYQLVYTFRDADGNDLLGQPVVLDLPQAQATTGGWVEVSTASLGAIVLPEDAASATVVLRKGADAAGAAYVDDLFVRTGTEGVWPGDLFNANVEVPGGWYYWWDGFPTGSPEWPAAQPFEVTVTTSEAHTGASSLRIEQRDPAASEAVAVSQRVPVTPGQPVLLSYWVKTAGNADPATIGTGDNNVGLTALWYNNMEGGAAGYGEIGGADIRLNGEYNPQVIPLLPQQADNGWTQYAFVLNPVAGAVGMEMRLRYWHSFTGATYWDDVHITNVGGAALITSEEAGPSAPGTPAAGSAWLRTNAPNPFSGATAVRFALPHPTAVTLEVYDLTGRRVAVLADNVPMAADEHEVAFDAGTLPTGTYLLVLRTPEHTEARAITLSR